jgi:hypothetical protein
MNKLSDDERNLLKYYAGTERILHRPARGEVHLHLLRSGYIEERTVNLQGALVVVTAAGRKASTSHAIAFAAGHEQFGPLTVHRSVDRSHSPLKFQLGTPSADPPETRPGPEARALYATKDAPPHDAKSMRRAKRVCPTVRGMVPTSASPQASLRC